MKLVGATGDWTAKTMTNAFPAIRGVYSLVGSTDRVERRRLRLPPQLQPDQPQRRLRLHGPLAARHRRLGEHPRRARRSPRSPRTSARSTPDHPAPPDRKTPEQLEADLIEITGQSDRRAGARRHVARRWEAARRFLMTSLKVRVGLVNPPPEAIEHREVRRADPRGSHDRPFASSAEGRTARRSRSSG